MVVVGVQVGCLHVYRSCVHLLSSAAVIQGVFQTILAQSWRLGVCVVVRLDRRELPEASISQGISTLGATLASRFPHAFCCGMRSWLSCWHGYVCMFLLGRNPVCFCARLGPLKCLGLLRKLGFGRCACEPEFGNMWR